MPLKPVCNTMRMPTATPADVRAVFEKGLSLASSANSFENDCRQRDLQDHLFYIGAVCPHNFAPLREELVRLDGKYLRPFACGLSTFIDLLAGTSDQGVDYLARAIAQEPKADNGWIRSEMLAAIGSPAALNALGELAGKYIGVDELERLGFWIPGQERPAEARFARDRQAIAIEPFTGSRAALGRLPHAVGLPVSDIMRDAKQTDVTWHYLSLDLARVQGLPPLPCAKVHLVSPPLNICWTLFCSIDAKSKYAFHSVVSEAEDPDEERGWMLERGYDDGNPAGWMRAELQPLDDRLTYCNGHIQWGNVVGTVGGPPIGLYDNPRCPKTGKLMFHVLSVTSLIREYGDGFRSLYVSEDSGLVACTATGWN